MAQWLRHPHSGSQLPITLVPEDTMPTSDFCRHQTCIWCKYKHAGKVLIHTKESKSLKNKTVMWPLYLFKYDGVKKMFAFVKGLGKNKYIFNSAFPADISIHDYTAAINKPFPLESRGYSTCFIQTSYK